MLGVTQLVGFNSVGFELPDVSYISTDEDNTSTTTYNFTSKSFGAAAADRFIVVGVVARKNSPDASISSLTVGGVSSSQRATQVNSGNLAELRIAPVPTGATGTISVTFAAAPIRIRVAWWRLTGLLEAGAAATSPAGSTASPLDLSLSSVPQFSAMIGIGGMLNGDASFSWSGLTEDFDSPISGGPNGVSGASGIASLGGSVSITATQSASNTPVGCSAAFR